MRVGRLLGWCVAGCLVGACAWVMLSGSGGGAAPIADAATGTPDSHLPGASLDSLVVRL